MAAHPPQSVPTIQQPPTSGYPALAAFINGSPSHTFQLFRRFGNLNARCLLYLQDEISELEEILDGYDREDHNSKSRRFDQHHDRGHLIQVITEKLAFYNAYLTQAAGLLSLQPASPYQIENFLNYFHHFNPVVLEESGFASLPHDLVALGGMERDWLHRKIEESNLSLSSSKHKSVPSELAPLAEYLVYTSHSRIRRFVRLWVLLFGLFSLLGPILAMYFVHSRPGRVAIVCGSIAAFGSVIALVTTAKNFELLAATAAYAAVVVVFLGSLTRNESF